MKTPDEIKKGLECCGNAVECSVVLCPYWNECDKDDIYAVERDALAYIQQLEAKVPKWISVEERLPDESEGTILVCFPDVSPYNLKEPFVNAKHDRHVRTATYSQYSKTWYIGDMCGVGAVNPTHWMPLPKPQEV